MLKHIKIKALTSNGIQIMENSEETLGRLTLVSELIEQEHEEDVKTEDQEPLKGLDVDLDVDHDLDLKSHQHQIELDLLNKYKLSDEFEEKYKKFRDLQVLNFLFKTAVRLSKRKDRLKNEINLLELTLKNSLIEKEDLVKSLEVIRGLRGPIVENGTTRSIQEPANNLVNFENQEKAQKTSLNVISLSTEYILLKSRLDYRAVLDRSGDP